MKINNYELIEIRDRLNTCYEYLRGRGIVHTQQDIADKMGSKKHSVSRAFNAVPEYLTESFLERFATSFSINYKWLRHGEGNMIDSESISIVNNQVGIGNHFSNNSTVERFLTELAAQRELTRETQKQLDKSQQQIDRLISIIETIKN